MTTYTYGEEPDSVLVNPSTGGPLSGRRVDIYTARGGTAVTDLLDMSGLPLSVGYVTSDAQGRFAFKIDRPSPPANLWAKGPIAVGQTPQYYKLTATEVEDLITVAAGKYADALVLINGQAADNASALAVATSVQTRQDDVETLTDGIVDTASTVDELCNAFYMPSYANSTTALQSLTSAIGSASIQSIFVAPFPLEITSLALVWEYLNQVADDTNYLQLNVYRQRVGTRVDIGYKTTKTPASGGEAITRRYPWTLDTAIWNATNAQLNAGDVLQVGFSVAGTAVFAFPLMLTWKYRPLR